MMLAIEAASGLTETLVKVAGPWSKVFSHSKAVSAGVLFLHLSPLIFGAGAAFMMDRATLRVVRAGPADRALHLRELSKVHRVVVPGLGLSFVSGLLLFLADVETFVGAIYFWVKLGFVALLLLNGFVMTRTEKALAANGEDSALWGRMRTLALLSAFLWLATALAGVVLKEFA